MQLYQSQDIYLVLVGLETWVSGDLVNIVQANYSATLTNFLVYVLASVSTAHDSAQLLTSVD